MGVCYLYVFSLACEDILELGLSQDPYRAGALAPLLRVLRPLVQRAGRVRGRDAHPEVEGFAPSNRPRAAHVYQLVYQAWARRSNDPLKRRKPALLRAFVYNWCPGEDSNLHGVAPAST